VGPSGSARSHQDAGAAPWGAYRRQVDARELIREVEAAFAETGAATPGWPHPHPGDVRPAEEEYSRESDPAKYRILGARVQAWSRALVATG